MDVPVIVLLFESGEYRLSVEEQANLIEKHNGSISWVLFVAEEKGKLIGFLVGTGGDFNRNRHTIQIAMGVRERSQGKGIGRQLLQSFIKWASGNQYHRIELSVMESNAKALFLYQSIGFEIEGLKRHSLKVCGVYVYEHYMAKFI
jgi:RimJ/RimL family protein N-acetyltransferase